MYHFLYFQIFYAIIIILALVFLVAVPVFVQTSSPGTRCHWNSWDYHGCNGECWNQLVNVDVPLTAFDITGLPTNCLIISLAIVSIIAAYMRKKVIIYVAEVIIYVAGCFIILAALVLMVYSGAMGGFFAARHAAPDLDHVTREVRSQLKNSLFSFREGDPIVNSVWENTMSDGCCCGVDGYSDFLELGQEIPEQCTCRIQRNSYSGNLDARCYDTGYNCHLDTKYNVTLKGCFGNIMRQIQNDRNDIHIAKMITFLSVSTLQLVIVILAMMCTSCCLQVPTKGGSSSSSSDSSRDRFAPLPEPEDTNDDVLIDASDKDAII